MNDTYNPVLVKSFSEIFFSVMLENTGNCWDTECYATEIEQLEPDGVMTNPYDQAAVFITAVLLFGNVMPKL